MAQPIIYSTPPIAGRPPFATDEPDSVYQQHTAQPRLRQQPPPDPNARTSAYNMYDQYLDEKSDAPRPKSTNPFDDMYTSGAPPAPIPLAAPRPGYAAPISALNLAQPSPVASPTGRGAPEMSQAFPKPLTLVSRQGTPSIPGTPGVPSSPHPLQPPMTPIAPAFIRPSSAASKDVKFAGEPIMRGDGEDTVIPRQGQPRGEEFWRRFSMVAHTEKPNSKSTWLKKTLNGDSRYSRSVFIIGMFLFVIVVGAIGLGIYIAHKNTAPTTLKAVGGSAEETAAATATAAAVAEGGVATSTYLHVTPTNTVARRSDAPEPTAAIVAISEAVTTPVAAVDDEAQSDSTPEWVHVIEGWLGLYSGASSPVDDEDALVPPANDSADGAADLAGATGAPTRRDEHSRAYTKAHPGPQARHRRTHLNRSF